MTAHEVEADVFCFAQTIDGDVKLRMTNEQASELRDMLDWLTDGDDE